MIEPVFTVTAFDPTTDSEHAWQAVDRCRRAILAEHLPGMPVALLVQPPASWCAAPPPYSLSIWITRTANSAVVALGMLWATPLVHAAYPAIFDLAVLPAFRRRGLGTQLLHVLVDQAARQGQAALVTRTFAAVPAGALFLARLKGRPGEAERMPQAAGGDSIWLGEIVPAGPAIRVWEVDAARVREYLAQRSVPL